MDPCPFIRMVVESLALKLPPVTKPAGHGIHPSPIQCFATLHIQDHPTSNPQTTPLPLAAASSSSSPSPVTSLTDTPDPTSLPPPLIFTLDQNTLPTLKKLSLIATVYMGKKTHACGVNAGRVKLGRVRIAVDVESGLSRPMVMQSGWVSLSSGGTRLHLVVRTEPDPRFVFAFGGEPECSPVVYQVQGGSAHQPVFSCRFSTDRRRNIRSRSLPPEGRNTKIRLFLSAFGSQKDQVRKDQRKGWTVTIHDLSGSPVAAASMITPFVPSTGSDRVSRSNPGAWLILRATGSSSTNNWKPWARFEAWRERGPMDALGYKFELNDGTSVAESSISMKRGGSFRIDPSGMMCGDHDVARSWPFVGGFVMESTVEGEGKVSKPIVHVGVQHVKCTGDIALFVALAAAVDLSMDACRLFSQKLRKELCSDQQEYRL